MQQPVRDDPRRGDGDTLQAGHGIQQPVRRAMRAWPCIAPNGLRRARHRPPRSSRSRKREVSCAASSSRARWRRPARAHPGSWSLAPCPIRRPEYRRATGRRRASHARRPPAAMAHRWRAGAAPRGTSRALSLEPLHDAAQRRMRRGRPGSEYRTRSAAAPSAACSGGSASPLAPLGSLTTQTSLNTPSGGRASPACAPAGRTRATPPGIIRQEEPSCIRNNLSTIGCATSPSWPWHGAADGVTVVHPT